MAYKIDKIEGIAPQFAEQLETWMHQADLMRVSGIGSEFGKLLESSGMQSVAELRDRNPENVENLPHRVNTEQKLTRALTGEGGLPKREFAGDSPTRGMRSSACRYDQRDTDRGTGR